MSEVTAVPLRPIAKGSLTKLWVGVAAIAAIGVAAAYAGTKNQVVMAMSPAEFLAANADNSGVVKTASGLQYKVLKEGSGPKPGPSDLVLVHYEGKLLNGKVFDTTKTDGNPRPMGVSGMIPGWTEGMQLVNQGSKVRFWFPPELAYGPSGAGNVIPPDSVLIFDVELLAIAPPQAAMGGMPAGHGGM